VRDNRTVDWRLNGVRVVRADELDPNTPQTPGMHREAAIDAARAGAEKLWAGTVVIHPDAKTGPHHHGELESVIYVVSADSAVLAGVWSRLMASELAPAFSTASTLLGVSVLGFTGQLVEIDLTAALPE